MTHSLQERYVVRMPDGMRDKIKEEAARNCRSMNAEIIYQLGRIYNLVEVKSPDAQRA